MNKRLKLTVVPVIVPIVLVILLIHALPHVLADVDGRVNSLESEVAVIQNQLGELTWEVRGVLLILCTIAFEIIRNWISLIKKP